MATKITGMTAADVADLGANTTLAEIAINTAVVPATRSLTFGKLATWLATVGFAAAAIAAASLALTGTMAAQNVAINKGALVASSPTTLMATWNNAAVTFTALTIATTDTASNAASKFVEYFAGAGGVTSVYAIRKDGLVTAAGGFASLAGMASLGASPPANGALNVDCASYTFGMSLKNGTNTGQITLSSSGALQIIAATASSTVSLQSSNQAKWTIGGVSGTSSIQAVQSNATFIFGAAASSVPMLKRSSAALQVRLGDDSAFAVIQGKLTTDTNYTAGVLVPTGSMVFYDATGTAYRVPCLL